MNKKFYIVKPEERIHALCCSSLDETCLQAGITIVGDDGKKATFPAWEVTLTELQDIYRAAGVNGFDLDIFRVAVARNREKDTFRWAKKEEYVKGYQSRNRRVENLRRIQRARRDEY